MNILEGVNTNRSSQPKFIIKSKSFQKQNKLSHHQNQLNYGTNKDAHQFITHMIQKSNRFYDFVQLHAIQQVQQFAEVHLYNNPSIRTIIKTVFDKLLCDRRIGKNLKGMNKDLLHEIENSIWGNLERQAELYKLQKQFKMEKSNLEGKLAAYQQDIVRQLENLKKEIQQ